MTWISESGAHDPHDRNHCEGVDEKDNCEEVEDSAESHYNGRTQSISWHRQFLLRQVLVRVEPIHDELEE